MGAYLDNSATTRPSRPVRQLAARLMESGWMNPSALYRPAMEVQKQVDAVRGEVLRAVEAGPGDRVVFTSGGTEADNLAILGALRVRKALVKGQIRPGIPVWQTGEESRFPGLPYVIFPGNVGADDELRRIAEILS